MRIGRRTALKITVVVVAVVAAAILPAVPVAAAPTSRVPVLMYHRIAQEPPLASRFPGLYVTPAAFDSQMASLKATGWRTITAAALGDDLLTGRAIPARTFVITLDDGHVDGYTDAWPIMQKYGFVGTYFVVTGHIGLPGFLTWDMAATLAQSGNEIANHTVDHVSLPSYHGAALAAQIDGAASAIETQLAARGVTTTVRTFAYPYGHTSLEGTQLLALRGYTLAVTTVFETHSVRISEPLLYPRVRVSRGESVRTFLPTVDDVSVIDWRGQLPVASGPARLSSADPAHEDLASPAPSGGPLVAAVPTGSFDPAGAGAAAPTEPPRPEPASLDPGAPMDALLGVGVLGVLAMLLLTSAAMLRRRRR